MRNIIERHKHRLHWILLFALACVIEWAAQEVKKWAGTKIVGPPAARPDSTGAER